MRGSQKAHPTQWRGEEMKLQCWNLARHGGLASPVLRHGIFTDPQPRFNVSSERWCSLTGPVAVSVQGGIGGYYVGQRDGHPLLALQHLYQHHLVSHPRMEQTSPVLASRGTIGARQVAMVPVIMMWHVIFNPTLRRHRCTKSCTCRTHLVLLYFYYYHSPLFNQAGH